MILVLKMQKPAYKGGLSICDEPAVKCIELQCAITETKKVFAKNCKKQQKMLGKAAERRKKPLNLIQTVSSFLLNPILARGGPGGFNNSFKARKIFCIS